MIKLFSKSRKPDPQYTLLLKDLYKTRSELANAYSNLEYMTDPDLIDYYIYQVKAAQMRHKFLLTKVKQFEDEDHQLASVSNYYSIPREAEVGAVVQI